MRKKWISGLAVLALGGAAAMATPNYTAVFLPSIGYAQTYAGDIANGQIVGSSRGAPVADALLWPDSYSTPTDLAPVGSISSALDATDGTTQVGESAFSGSDANAALWQGTSSSFVNLNPAGFTTSEATGISGGQEVGLGAGPSTNGQNHALLWYGTAASAVDLNPPAYYESDANRTDGVHQVGYVTPYNSDGTVGERHAAIWSGTAASMVDINPPDALTSTAAAIAANIIGGYASFRAGGSDAVIWDLSDGTFSDLNPSWASRSAIGAAAGIYEVGFADPSTAPADQYAVVWSGSSPSAINLNSFLPTDLQNNFATAFGVDQYGDVVGEVDTVTGAQAVLWLAPEPQLTALALVALLGFRRSNQQGSAQEF